MKTAASSIADSDIHNISPADGDISHEPRRASRQPTFGLLTAFDIGFLRASIVRTERP